MKSPLSEYWLQLFITAYSSAAKQEEWDNFCRVSWHFFLLVGAINDPGCWQAWQKQSFCIEGCVLAATGFTCFCFCCGWLLFRTLFCTGLLEPAFLGCWSLQVVAASVYCFSCMLFKHLGAFKQFLVDGVLLASFASEYGEPERISPSAPGQSHVLP